MAITAPEPTGIKTATTADEQRVIDILALAFSSDPIMRWFYPTPHEYLLHFPEFIRIYAGKAFNHDTAYYLEEFTAAALWLPPDIRPDEDALVALFKNTLSEERLEQVGSVMERIESHHPTEPYWHLPVIGVDPTHQRNGYGSVLMEHALVACDREGTPAYLESSNPENISLYVRYGFEILDTIQVGTMPPLTPMLRTPRACPSYL